MTQNNLDVIQEKIGYEFKNKYLLTQAFTRRSFAAENQGYEDNEKLEFVGDKVLDFIVVKKLTQEYSFVGKCLAQSVDSIERGEKPSPSNVGEIVTLEFSHDEREMTEIKKQLVQTSFLSAAVEALGLENYLIMGKGDVKNGVECEPHVKEDLFEAIIGAVAIDCDWNMSVLEAVVEKILNLSYYIENGVDGEIDHVSYIREWYMKEYGKEPDYGYSAFEGGGFGCTLDLPGYSGGCFDAVSRSKKGATKTVARRAYEFLKERESTSERIMKVIGTFDLDSAINKLQMLQDHKIISGLEYSFTEEKPTEVGNGNPIWFCRVTVDGVDKLVEYGDSTKTRAKKLAAYEMLCILLGKEDLGMVFFTKGITVI